MVIFTRVVVILSLALAATATLAALAAAATLAALAAAATLAALALAATAAFAALAATAAAALAALAGVLVGVIGVLDGDISPRQQASPLCIAR